MRIWRSKVDDGPVAVHYTATAGDSRSAPADILQCATKRLQPGQVFRAHTHLPLERTTIGTQEAWVVVAGRVEVDLFDVDDSLLGTFELSSGDCIVLLRGGHAMRVNADTLLYEFKNGPYQGQKADKRWHG